MPKKKIPIGIENFYKLVNGDYLFCDKSLMIQEFLDSGAEVTLITRQRRSGKSLNMSMLQHFLAPKVNDKSTKGLFDGLKVAEVDGGRLLEKYQGKHPVIFISLKDVKRPSLERTIKCMALLIQEVASEFIELSNSTVLSAADKNLFNQLLSGTTDIELLIHSLKILSRLLFTHYHQYVYILIDEYDTPLHAAYGKSYLSELTEFMRDFCSASLKSNPVLAKGLMTGILRISKDSMLSGLNNLKVYTLLDAAYKDHFGFNEKEMTDLFNAHGIEAKLEEIKAWYNGYRSFDVVVYNPWSIMNCLDEGGVLEAYWVNVAKNNLVKEVVVHSDVNVKIKLEILMAGGSIEAQVDKHVTFETLLENPAALWGLLLFTGYLKSTDSVYDPKTTNYTCQLAIPNKEVHSIYIKHIMEWMRLEPPVYQAFITELVQGDAEGFTTKLGTYLLQSASYFDVTHEKTSEIFYHGFVLALIASVNSTHHVRSNRESGLGRYDISLFPKGTDQHLGVILEFKHAKDVSHAEALADAALKQINEQLYATDLETYSHIKKILKVGIAFSGKLLVSSYETIDLVTHEIKRGIKRKITTDEKILTASSMEIEKKSGLAQASSSSSKAGLIPRFGLPSSPVMTSSHSTPAEDISMSINVLAPQKMP